MMRKCHLNTARSAWHPGPGAAQALQGPAEHVVNYFFFVAEEAREIMAQLGIRRLDELIGRATCSTCARASSTGSEGARLLAHLLQPPMPHEVARRHCETQDHGLDRALDHKLIAVAQPALERQERVSFISPIRNVNRTVGTMLSAQVARRYGHQGLPDDTIHIQFQGTAGQSFGAFLAHGITLDLVGDANDYTGKGLSGGRVIVRSPNDFRGFGPEHIIVGNTVLYGAIAARPTSTAWPASASPCACPRQRGGRGHGRPRLRVHDKGTVVVLGGTGRTSPPG